MAISFPGIRGRPAPVRRGGEARAPNRLWGIESRSRIGPAHEPEDPRRGFATPPGPGDGAAGAEQGTWLHGAGRKSLSLLAAPLPPLPRRRLADDCRPFFRRGDVARAGIFQALDSHQHSPYVWARTVRSSPARRIETPTDSSRSD